VVAGVVYLLLFRRGEGKALEPNGSTAASSAGGLMTGIQTTRAWTGLWVVLAGDIAIAVAAIWGVTHLGKDNAEVVVAVLTSAFTGIATLTTAYFGIRAAANAAQAAIGDGKKPADERKKPVG
jgi:hypothetical protein